MDKSDHLEPHLSFLEPMNPEKLVAISPTKNEFIVSILTTISSMERDRLRETTILMLVSASLSGQKIAYLPFEQNKLRKYLKSYEFFFNILLI